MARNYQTGVIITGDAKGGVKAINLTEKELGKLNERSKKTSNSMGAMGNAFSIATKLAGPLSVTLSGIKLIDLVADAVRTAESLDKMTAKLGISAEALSELRYAAELSSVPVATLEMGLQRMQRRLGEVASLGKGEAKAALDVLGLSAQELTNIPLDAAFEEIAEALSKVENEAQRTALAAKIFDSEGVKLLQTMRNGAAGIREMREEAERLGLTISQETAAAAADFSDNLDRLASLSKGLGRAIANDLLPYLNKFLELLTTIAGVNPDIIALRSLEEMRQGIDQSLSALDTYRNAMAKVGDATGGLAKGIDATKQQLIEQIKAYRESSGEAGAFELIVQQLGLTLEDVAPAAEDVARALAGTGTGTGTGGVSVAVAAREAAEAVAEIPEKTQIAAESTVQEVDGLVAAWERGIERIDDAIADWLKTLITDGRIAFDDFKDLFLDTLAEMVAAAVRNPIMVTLGLTSASGSAMADQANPLSFLSGGGSSIASTLNSLFLGSGTGPYQGFSFAGSNAAAGISGLIGGFVADAVFDGSYSGMIGGIGSAVGFLAGGPIGAAIGSLAGGFIGTLFDDKTNPRLGLMSGADYMGSYEDNYFVRTPFGTTGFRGATHGFSVATEGAAILESIKLLDEAIASIMSPEEIEAAALALGEGVAADFKGALKDLEGFDERDLGDLFKERFQIVVGVLDGVLGNDLAQWVNDFSGTAEEFATGVARWTSSVAYLQNALAIDPFDAYAAAIENANTSVFESFSELGDEIIRLVDNFDGTLPSLESIASGVQGFSASLIGVLNDIQGAQAFIEGGFAGGIESLRLMLMGDQEKYDYFKAQADALAATIPTITDPAQLEAALSRLLELGRSGAGLLNLQDPAQAGMLESIIAQLEEAGVNAESVLMSAEDTARAQWEEVMTRVGDGLDLTAKTFDQAASQVSTASDAFLSAAAAMQDAASVFTTAVNTPITVNVNTVSQTDLSALGI